MASACLICASAETAVRYQGLRDVIGRSGDAYDLLRCRACGSLSASPIPTPERIAALYPEHYTFRRHGARTSAQRVVQELFWWGYHRWTYTVDVAAVRRLTGRSGGRLLDVGCGGGIHLRLLAEAGFAVEGMEISAEDCGYVEGTLGYPAHRGSLASSTLAPAQFDVITLFNTLEHLPDPRPTAQAAFRLLRPGGWLVVKIPMADGWQPAVSGARWRNIREVPRHLALASQSGIRRLLADAGFAGIRLCAASRFEDACMAGTTLYPWAIPYRNEAGTRSGLVKLVHTSVGAMLTYAMLPFAVLEALAGRPSTAIIAAHKP